METRFKLNKISHYQTLLPEILEFITFKQVLTILLSTSKPSRLYVIRNYKLISRNKDDIRVILTSKTKSQTVKTFSFSQSKTERMRFVVLNDQGFYIVGGGGHKMFVLSQDMKQVVQKVCTSSVAVNAICIKDKVYVSMTHQGIYIYQFKDPPVLQESKISKKIKKQYMILAESIKPQSDHKYPWISTVQRLSFTDDMLLLIQDDKCVELTCLKSKSMVARCTPPYDTNRIFTTLMTSPYSLYAGTTFGLCQTYLELKYRKCITILKYSF